MANRENALRQIEEIAEVMRSSFTIALPAALFLAVGAGLLAVPLCEMFFSRFVDGWLFSLCHSVPCIFILRTIFYWVTFASLSRMCIKREGILHPAIRKAWALNPFFPLIPLATASMLWFAGYTPLISPMIMILVGLYFAHIARFAQPIINGLAFTYIIGGLLSIYLASLQLPHLWYYLLSFQGLSCVITGLILRFKKS